MKKVLLLVATILVSHGTFAKPGLEACSEVQLYKVLHGMRKEVTHKGIVFQQNEAVAYRLEVTPIDDDRSYMNSIKVCVETDANCGNAKYYNPDRNFRCPWGWTQPSTYL